MKRSISKMIPTTIVILCAVCASCSKSAPNEEAYPTEESTEQQSTATRASYTDISLSPNHSVLIPGDPYNISIGIVLTAASMDWEDPRPVYNWTISEKMSSKGFWFERASGTTRDNIGTFTFPILLTPSEGGPFVITNPTPTQPTPPSKSLVLYKVVAESEANTLEKQFQVANRPVIGDRPTSSVNKGDTYTLAAWGADPNDNSSFMWKYTIPSVAGAININPSLSISYGNSLQITFDRIGTYEFTLSENQATYGISVDSQKYVVTVK